MPRRSRASLATLVLLLVLPATHTAFAQTTIAANDPPSDTASDPAAAAPAPQQPPPLAPQTRSGFIGEPGFLSSAIMYANNFGGSTGKPKEGFYPEFSNMITGAGWLAVGPGYRHYLANERAFVETSAAISWHLYNMGQAKIEAPELANRHLTLGAQGMWQDNTQVQYFGIGPDAPEDARSQYRLQTHDIVGYAIANPKDRDWLAFSGKFGWLGRPAVMEAGGTFKRDDAADTRLAFASDPAVSLSEQPSFLHSEAAVTADTRDHRGHPTRGFLYRGALTNYWDRSDELFTFHTWEAEALQYVPLAEDRIVLAFHGWTVAGDTSGANQIPFYLLPMMGGARTLRDYHDFQFHDRNLLVLNAESRFAVWTHLDAAIFGDVGNVAGRYSDLNLDKTSYGVGLRLHNDTTTVARMDMAHGPQGWHVIIATTEPFRLSRVRREVATVPFTP